jgi:hypothetical protein
MEEFEGVLETGGVAAAELVSSKLAAWGGRCASCGATLTGPFCAVCGQPVEIHRRSVTHLTRDFVNDIASFDARILRTARALLFKPGELAKAFREGRTQPFVPPVRLYLFVSLIFFLVLSLSSVAIFQIVLVSKPERVIAEKGRFYLTQPGGGRQEVPARYNDGKQHYSINSQLVFFAREGSLHGRLAEEAQRRLVESTTVALNKNRDERASVIARTVLATTLKLAKDPAVLNGALTTWIPRALFLLLPIFALLLAAFYWRQRKTLYFVDHLVFSLGFHSFGFALLLVAAGLAQVIPGDAVAWLSVTILVAYLLLAMKRAYGQNWWWTGAKCAAVALIYTFVFVLPAFGGVIVASVLWG